MPKTLAEINELLGAEAAADLTEIIAEVKRVTLASHDGVIADLKQELVTARKDAEAAAAAAKQAADTALSELQAKLDQANRTAQLNSDSAKDVIAQLTGERDAQVARAQQLGAAAAQLETAEDALDAQWQTLRAQRKQVVEAANQGRKEQLAAQLAAQQAELDRQKAAAGLA
jgi:predicted mannosyl-3-phosphoglycerate phosphatase (HAD superfamily)